MPTGKVKWYNPDKGYGFIAPDDGSQSLYINEAILKAVGLFSLCVDETVEYEMEKRRVVAISIKPHSWKLDVFLPLYDDLDAIRTGAFEG